MTISFGIVALLAIIAFTILAFAFEWMAIDVVALTALALLLLFDLVTWQQAIAGFSNPAVITVMMMFVLSSALVHSGLVTKLGYWVAELTGKSHRIAAILLLLVAGSLSSLINNTAAVSVLMPVSLHLARHYRFSPSKILMPLSFAAMIGGTCTLIGTSTNLLVSSLSAEQGGRPFSVFEFLPLGGVFFVVGLIYIVLVPMRFLPSRTIISSLTRKYQIHGFVTELNVPSDSKLIGKTVVEEDVSHRFQMTVLEILRGDQKIVTDLRNTRLRSDDVLLVRGEMEDILSFKTQFGLLLLTELKLRDSDFSDENTILAEIQLAPTSRLVGSNLKELNFRQRFGAFVLAVNRTGGVLRGKLARARLKQWDTLLVFGPRSRVEALYQLDDFISLAERELHLRLSKKWWIGALVIPIVVTLAATGTPIVKVAILGVVALVLLNALSIQQVYQAIDWRVIFLLATILPLGTAMINTGLAELIGKSLGGIGAAHGPTIMMSVLYLATGLLTSFFSNNATAVLMVPLAISAAHSIGVDPKPLLMAVTFSASASFMTPVGYQTNTMVYGPGNYKFSDYFVFGAPLNLMFWILATWLIPLLWPFHPTPELASLGGVQ